LAGTGSALAWVAIHINHHLKSDKPGDPHSPLYKGFRIFSLDYETDVGAGGDAGDARTNIPQIPRVRISIMITIVIIIIVIIIIGIIIIAIILTIVIVIIIVIVVVVVTIITTS
jgi:fatty-acid desaturase